MNCKWEVVPSLGGFGFIVVYCAAFDAPCRYGLARAHAWIGNADEAFRYLDAAATQNPAQLGGAATNPLFQRLQEDPRWLAFLSSIGQTPEQLAAFKLNVEPPA